MEPRPADVAAHAGDPGTPSDESRGSAVPVAAEGAAEPAGSGRSARVSDSAPGARQNEMEPMWQADSWSWPTTELGEGIPSEPPEPGSSETGDDA